MTTPAVVTVQKKLSQMGISLDQQTIAEVVYSTSSPLYVSLNDSMRVSLNEYMLTDRQTIPEDFRVYQSESSSNLTSFENLLEHELYVQGTPQTLPVSINLETNVVSFVADVSSLNTLVCFRVLDLDKAVNSVLFSHTVANPVTQVTKGEITIKADTALDVAIKAQKLRAMSGDDVLVDSVTRYSTGKIKGRR